METPERRLTMRNEFSNNCLFTVIRDLLKLLEMQIEASVTYFGPFTEFSFIHPESFRFRFFNNCSWLEYSFFTKTQEKVL